MNMRKIHLGIIVLVLNLLTASLVYGQQINSAQSMKKSLCVIPEDGMVVNNNVILCAGNYNLPSGIVVGRSNITLSCGGATLMGNDNGQYTGSTGIYANGKKNLKIKNCIVENYQYGLHLVIADNSIVSNNILRKNTGGNGYIDSSKNLTVINNELRDTNDLGLILVNSSSNKIQSNKFFNNEVALILNTSNFNSVTSNYIDNSTVYGILLSSSSGNNIDNNQIVNSTAGNGNIGVEDTSTSNLIRNNKISGGFKQSCTGYCGTGIRIQANGNQIYSNEVFNAGVGIEFGGDYNIAALNILRDNQVKGFILEGKNNIVAQNTLLRNGQSIYWCCGWAVGIDGDNNSFYLNNLIDNYNGLYINNYQGNFIYWNNFINTAVDEASTSSTLQNYFDYQGKGNYWSSYDTAQEGCIDNNQDGFCDNPYIINPYNQDNFPLVNQL